MATLEQMRTRFADHERWFHDSPLYQALAGAVCADEALLSLAAMTPPGPQPANMLMAATHLVVLSEPDDPFARFFPSVVGPAAAAPPPQAAAEYADFCARHRGLIATTLRTRLVQTNEPARATAVRVGLHEVARRVEGPVTFLEVGSSAGIQLCFDRWRVRSGGRCFGPPQAPLTIDTEWRGDGPPPDLDAIPPIADRLGIDLQPVDAGDPQERRWLEALVWPEHVQRLAALRAALDVVAADPPEIVAGDAIERLRELDRTRLSTARPLVIWHSQVRIHVPSERRAAFDAAIAALGARRRLLHLALEHRDEGAALLSLSDSAGEDITLGRAHGHGRWIAPAPAVAPVTAGRAR